MCACATERAYHVSKQDILNKAVVVLLVLAALSRSAFAGAGENPPSAEPVRPVAVEAPKPHKFFDVKNTLSLGSFGMGLTADALSTQRGLAYPRFSEMNPIARPFVQTRGGAAAYSAASFALMGGGMYLAHKTGHHKLERITPFVLAGWEGFLAARNYHLVSKAAAGAR